MAADRWAVPELDLLEPGTLPGHRILLLTLRNAGEAPAAIGARQIVLEDDDGAPLKAVVTFDRESQGPGTRVEAKRAALWPGREIAITVAWHSGDAARLTYPGGAAELPPSRPATSGPPA